MPADDPPTSDQAEPANVADGPVTTTITRRVKPRQEPFYERFVEGIIASATKYPGHLGVEVFRPGPSKPPPGSTGWSTGSTPPST
jgi:hypothetical protein